MFRTEVKVTPSNLNLTIQDGIVTIGSCFAEVIGNKLQENKVTVLVNPFGTIFNPVSVASLLQASTGITHNLEQSLVQRDSIWYNHNLHSSISSPSKQELHELILQRIRQTSQKLSKASLLIVTLGTAIGYELTNSGELVANCHKLPAKLFNRKLLSTTTINEALGNAFQRLQEVNPSLQVVLTVSPVRHVKETLQLNSVSKATLRVASHELSEQFEHVHYFPAFEIMADDLRDYRFYGQDMLHPTSVAEDYIWEKFTTAYYHPSFQEFTHQWAKIRRAMLHRPFHPDSPEHQKFLQNTLAQLQQLEMTYNININAERDILEQQLTE